MALLAESVGHLLLYRSPLVLLLSLEVEELFRGDLSPFFCEEGSFVFALVGDFLRRDPCSQ